MPLADPAAYREYQKQYRLTAKLRVSNIALELQKPGVRARFDAYLSKERVDSGCIEWQGTRNGNGYGKFTINGRKVFAHRAAYILARGPIPEGLHLDHLCRNRNCVNADHLEPVTVGENSLRGEHSKHKAHRIGMCERGLHPLAGPNLGVKGNGTQYCRTCSNEYKRALYRAKKSNGRDSSCQRQDIAPTSSVRIGVR